MEILDEERVKFTSVDLVRFKWPVKEEVWNLVELEEDEDKDEEKELRRYGRTLT